LAGIDMALALIARLHDREVAASAADHGIRLER
jgi:hypothetical protein